MKYIYNTSEVAGLTVRCATIVEISDSGRLALIFDEGVLVVSPLEEDTFNVTGFNHPAIADQIQDLVTPLEYTYLRREEEYETIHRLNNALGHFQRYREGHQEKALKTGNEHDKALVKAFDDRIASINLRIEHASRLIHDLNNKLAELGG